MHCDRRRGPVAGAFRRKARSARLFGTIGAEGAQINVSLGRASVLIGALLATLLLSACASYQSYQLVNPQPVDIERKVKVGETVTVFTTEGKTLNLRVTAITSDTLIGEDSATFAEHKISFREIGLLEKKPTRKLPETAIALSIIFSLMLACCD